MPPLSLASTEIARLYALTAAFDAREEEDARRPLPVLADLPSVRQFELLSADHRRPHPGRSVWRGKSLVSRRQQCRHRRDLRDVGQGVLRTSAAPVVAAARHRGRDRRWHTARGVEQLIRAIEDAAEANAQCALARHHRPQLSSSLPPHKQRQLAREIVQHLEAGKGLTLLHMATRAEWRQFVKTATVASGEPSRIEHFRVLAQLAHLAVCRVEMEDSWDALIGKHIHSPFRSMGPEPELACRALTDEIRRCLDWHAMVWSPLHGQLAEEGSISMSCRRSCRASRVRLRNTT